MREHKEPVVPQRLPHRLGDVLGFKGDVAAEQLLQRPGVFEHPCPDTLQADRLDHHAPVPSQNSPNRTACTARIDEAIARLGDLAVAITIDLKFL